MSHNVIASQGLQIPATEKLTPDGLSDAIDSQLVVAVWAV